MARQDGNHDGNLFESPVHGKDEDPVLEPESAFGFRGHPDAAALVAELVEAQLPSGKELDSLFHGREVEGMDEYVGEAALRKGYLGQFPPPRVRDGQDGFPLEAEAGRPGSGGGCGQCGEAGGRRAERFPASAAARPVRALRRAGGGFSGTYFLFSL